MALCYGFIKKSIVWFEVCCFFSYHNFAKTEFDFNKLTSYLPCVLIMDISPRNPTRYFGQPNYGDLDNIVAWLGRTNYPVKVVIDALENAFGISITHVYWQPEYRGYKNVFIVVFDQNAEMPGDTITRGIKIVGGDFFEANPRYIRFNKEKVVQPDLLTGCMRHVAMGNTPIAPKCVQKEPAIDEESRLLEMIEKAQIRNVELQALKKWQGGVLDALVSVPAPTQ